MLKLNLSAWSTCVAGNTGWFPAGTKQRRTWFCTATGEGREEGHNDAAGWWSQPSSLVGVIISSATADPTNGCLRNRDMEFLPNFAVLFAASSSASSSGTRSEGAAMRGGAGRGGWEKRCSPEHGWCCWKGLCADPGVQKSRVSTCPKTKSS